jgi:hypothetical protein
MLLGQHLFSIPQTDGCHFSFYLLLRHFGCILMGSSGRLMRDTDRYRAVLQFESFTIR